MRQNLKAIIRKLDFTQSEETLDANVKAAVAVIDKGSYDFSNYTKQLFTRNGKKRQIYMFEALSVENILCHYLKSEIDNAFHVKYASRSKIIHLLFNSLPTIKDMNDFVIIRADFKDFFNSILTKHVFDEYIRDSVISRADKDILGQYVSVFEYCYAGLCLSNEMAEIVCRDFDRLIKARLEKYGVFFYERYVDDMFIMLKSYMSKDEFLQVTDAVIREVFGRCPVHLSMEPDKFSFITCRELQQSATTISAGTATEKLTFLGYEFFIDCAGSEPHSISFRYGISEKKRERYRHLIEPAFLDYVRYGNEELLRQRIKLFSARVVISRSLGNNRVEWLTNGITANYGELRYHIDELDSATEAYLKTLFTDILSERGVSTPYYLTTVGDQNSVYNLYSNLTRNRSIVFDKKIGVQRQDLVRWIRKIDPTYSDDNKQYYRIVMEYFELLKTNSTTP